MTRWQRRARFFIAVFAVIFAVGGWLAAVTTTDWEVVLVAPRLSVTVRATG